MRVRYLSLFSGIGGFELGFQQAADELGIEAECVGYSDIDKHALATYERRFPEHRNLGDVTLIDADALPDFSLLFAGFPCQAFSVAGQRRGFDDTRGTLFFDVARILRAKRPQNFILENVKGLVSHDRGRTLRVILQTLTDLGYCVEWQVLNAKNFGVPQSRERIYLVGHLGGVPDRSVLPLTGAGNPHTTVGVSAEAAVARTYTAGGKSGGYHSGMTVIREVRTVPLEGFALDTLVATGAIDPAREAALGVVVHRDRRLTPVEAERLFGFPDGWTVGSVAQRCRQLGNSIVVPVVRRLCLGLFAQNLFELRVDTN